MGMRDPPVLCNKYCDNSAISGIDSALGSTPARCKREPGSLETSCQLRNMRRRIIGWFSYGLDSHYPIATALPPSSFALAVALEGTPTSWYSQAPFHEQQYFAGHHGDVCNCILGLKMGVGHGTSRPESYLSSKKLIKVKTSCQGATLVSKAHSSRMQRTTCWCNQNQ